MSSIRVLVCLLVVFAAGNSYALDLSKWQYKADVIIEDFNDSYYSFELSPQVYDRAMSGFADLRLIGDDSSQIPYVIAAPRDLKESVKYQPREINRTVSQKNASMLTLDFERQTAKNLIEVITGGDNFRRAVKIEGSNDNIEYFTLVREAFVFAAGLDKTRRFEQINLPANDYRYLRISVMSMPSEKNPPVIQTVQSFKTSEKLARRIPVEMIPLEQTQDSEKKISLYSYDLGFKNLPIDKIELQVPDNEFYRQIIIEGRDSLKTKVPIYSEDSRERFRDVNTPWNFIAHGTIYRYETAGNQRQERLSLDLSLRQTKFRYLRITVQDYDDKPISIADAKAFMIAEKLIFRPDNRKSPVLYLGSAAAQKPSYDLSRILSNPLEINSSRAVLGEIINNPTFKDSSAKTLPWTEQHKWLLIAVMVFIVIVLGFFAFNSFKSIKAEQADK